MSDTTILTFDNSKKKPRAIEHILPWPPSPGLMKEMEQGTITKCSFAIPIQVINPGPSHDDIMRTLENKRKL